jgi:hypothetical protein
MNIRHLEKCVMLDTIGFTVKDVNAELPTTVDVNGKRRKSIGRLYSPSGRKSVTFNHLKKNNQLRVEGSAMHFQDHNIVASNDLRMTVLSLLKAIKDTHKVDISPRQAYQFFLGQDIAMTRVDTPAMLRLPDGLTPAAVVNGLALAGLRCGLTVSLYPNETFYFDQHSQMVSLKGYLKDVQIAQQKKKAQLPATENAAALRELACSTLRMEVTYRQKHFKGLAQFAGTLPTFGDLSPRVLAEMFAGQLEKYNLRGQLRAFVTEDDLLAAGIPRQYRATVMLWQHGYDLLKHFEGDSRALGRQRNILKKNYSIDINEMPPGAIEVPVQIGELLRSENFVPVLEAIQRDPQLFHTSDVSKAWRSVCGGLGITSGISRAFVDLYEDPDLPDTPQLPDFAAD